MSKYKLWRGLAVVFAALTVILIFLAQLLFVWEGQVNLFLNVEVPTIETGGKDSVYYDSDYGLTDAGLTEMLAASDKHDVRTMEEGAVLLKNDNAALPLAASERSVTLFGRAVTDPVYRGASGGPTLDTGRLYSLEKALKEQNFNINDALLSAYASSGVKRVNAGDARASIGEVPVGFHASYVNTWSSNYNDAAIIMFARNGDEGYDLSFRDADGISQLALHPQEKDILELVAANKGTGAGQFNKIIVLINSPNAMELKWIEDPAYKIDSALWIGGAGLLGFKGVGNILTGAADPSGRFVDTYATDSMSSAAVQNAGDFTFAGSGTEKYIVEAEGIYGGYKYYETRYQDWVLGINNADGREGVFVNADAGWDYSEEMAYTFGYGTSYAEFTQELKSLDWDRETHKVTASVKVTNDGVPANSEYTGRSKFSVGLYVQLPYASGQAERSAIQLIDFEKTDYLAKGESELVEFTVDDYLFATYDANATNGADAAKKGCYVFDPGNYYFAIGSDSHNALNNVLKARETEESLTLARGLIKADGTPDGADAAMVRKVTLDALDNKSYAKSRYTDEIVSNRFDDIDINYFHDTDVVTYLTRSDWNTFPERYTSLALTPAMSAQTVESYYVKPDNAPEYTGFTQGADVTLKLVEMKDIPYEDPRWETFLDQLSIANLTVSPGENFGQNEISRIGKPYNKNSDGPSGSQSNYIYGGKGIATTHVNEVVAASSWSKEVLAERGDFIAEDCLFSGTSQLWSPGANLHRTPFSGRNFEYYSEDPIMTYVCGAVQTEAMQAKGLCASPKHFAGNDQETNRVKLYTFMNEQSFRQGALKGFEGAFTVGGALGTMMGYNRIGCHRMYDYSAVLTQVMRNEWDYKGFTLTDSLRREPEINFIECLVAGSDAFNVGTNISSKLSNFIVKNKDGYVLQKLREANKHFYYAMSRTSLMNGITPDTEIPDFLPWWKPTIIVIVCVAGVIALAFTGLFIYSGYINKRKNGGSM